MDAFLGVRRQVLDQRSRSSRPFEAVEAVHHTSRARAPLIFVGLPSAVIIRPEVTAEDLL
ncbi:MAG: hypothetical protein R3F61_31695 [Myxococcota bacterium]